MSWYFNKKQLSKMVATILTLLFILLIGMNSTFAYPAEYEVLNSETHGFESGNDGISLEGATTIARSTAKSHTGSYSMALTCNNGSNARVWFNPTTKFTAGSKYYLSYWFYSDSWGGNTASTNGGGGLTLGAWGTSATTKGQWNKAWTTITCKADQTWIQLGFWQLTTGNVVYIDDLELIKVSDTTLKNDEIPAGTEAAAIGYINGETTESNFNPVDKNKEALTRSAEFARWGNFSWKLSNKTAAELGTEAHGLYLSVRDQLLKLGANGTLKTDTPYYISYYVYSPSVAVTTKVVDHLRYNEVVMETAVPQGTWTKVSQIFRLSESDGRFLLKLFIENAGTNDVYIDDIILAELSTEPAKPEITSVEVTAKDFDAQTATVTFTSPVKMKSVTAQDITAPTGITVTSVALSGDGKTITVGLSGINESTNYELIFTDIRDDYNRKNTFKPQVSIPSAMVTTQVGATPGVETTTFTKNIKKESNGTAKIALIVASYDAQGVLVGIGIDIKDVVGKDPVGSNYSVNVANGTSYKAVTLNWPTGVSTIFSSIEEEVQ